MVKATIGILRNLVPVRSPLEIAARAVKTTVRRLPEPVREIAAGYFLPVLLFPSSYDSVRRYLGLFPYNKAEDEQSPAAKYKE